MLASGEAAEEAGNGFGRAGALIKAENTAPRKKMKK